MRRMRSLAVVAAVVASTLGGVVATSVTPAAVSATPVVTPTIDPTSKASVTNAYRDSLGEARTVPTGWTGNTATCTRGTESTASIDATRAAVNFFRAMNRLPAITMDPTLHDKALAAALMMQAAGQLSHSPGPSWPCYTAEGAAGAAGGNLSQQPAAKAIESYMEDPGASNTFAGHRRWVLYPPMTTFGTGSTSADNSLMYGATGSRPGGVDWVAWPNAGFVPKSLVKPLFSLSSNALPDADYTGASVSVKIGATALPVTVHPVVVGYGDRTLTWDVTLPSGFATSAGDTTFDISVSGIKTSGGAAVPTHTYSSTAFVAGAPGAPANVTASLNGSFAQVSWDAPGYDGGSVPTGYAITPYISGVAQPTETYGNSPTQFIGPLVSGASYTFKVQAINVAGTGTLSAASNAVVLNGSPTAPSTPTNVTATAGNAQATVSWTAPAANGGAAINAYSITPYIGATAQPSTYQATTATSAVITGLANGTAYTFKVNAWNSVGNSQKSLPSNAVTPTAEAPAYAPFASWSAFVARQFHDLVDRAPTSSESSSWVSQLNGGTKTKGDLDDVLRRSTENTTHVDPVARLYRAFLARTPDAGGLAFWVGRIRSGQYSLTKMADYFANSAEFKTKYGALTNRAFVTRIYTDVLGRTADPSGVDFWTGQLDTKKKTRGQVMVGFSESAEYKGKQAQNTDVAVAHIFLLGRTPTSSEVTDWTTREKAGTTDAALLTELLDSAAYATHITG